MNTRNSKIPVYTSINEVPVDVNIPLDTGDRAGKNSPSLQPSEPMPSAYIIPFTRVIKFGTRGDDVKGVKRALSRAGYMKWGVFTNFFGIFAVAATKKFQKDNGLIQDGQIGVQTLRELAAFFDAYGFLLYTGYTPGSNKSQQKRNSIVAYCLWGYNNRNQIHYLQRRPMQYLNSLLHLPVDEDCSEFATKAYKYGDAPDPNNENPPFNGFGNTTTMHANGKRVFYIDQAKPGDLVLYGDPIEHVAVYIGNNKVCSNGSDPGPFILMYDYRKVAEIRTYLS